MPPSEQLRRRREQKRLDELAKQDRLRMASGKSHARLIAACKQHLLAYFGKFFGKRCGTDFLGTLPSFLMPSVSIPATIAGLGFEPLLFQVSLNYPLIKLIRNDELANVMCPGILRYTDAKTQKEYTRPEDTVTDFLLRTRPNVLHMDSLSLQRRFRK